MTQNYINGFFTKCAERKVPYDLAVALYKRAAGPVAVPAPAAKPSPVKAVKGPYVQPAAGAAPSPSPVPKKVLPTPNDAVKKIRDILAERRAKKVPAVKAASVEKTPVPAPTK